jgi:hypothetical protein
MVLSNSPGIPPLKIVISAFASLAIWNIKLLIPETSPPLITMPIFIARLRCFACPHFSLSSRALFAREITIC